MGLINPKVGSTITSFLHKTFLAACVSTTAVTFGVCALIVVDTVYHRNSKPPLEAEAPSIKEE